MTVWRWVSSIIHDGCALLRFLDPRYVPEHPRAISLRYLGRELSKGPELIEGFGVYHEDGWVRCCPSWEAVSLADLAELRAMGDEYGRRVRAVADDMRNEAA